MRPFPLLPFLLLPALLPAQEASPQSGPRELDHGELESFRWRFVEIPAPSLDEETARYAIYLPAGAEPGTRHPWVLWLHGMNGNHARFHRHGAPVLDDLRGAGTIPDLVLVAPSATRRPLYLDGSPAGDEETFLLEDLSRHIESEYPVRRDRRGRAVMGVSMGGMGAMRLAFKHPDRFAAVGAHSSPVMPADPDELTGRAARMARWLDVHEVFGDPIDPAKWRAECPTAILADKGHEGLAGLAIYFDAGTSDRLGFGPLNARLHRHMQDLEIPHTFRLVENGGHSWGSGAVQDALRTSLPFVAEALTRPAGDDGGEDH